MRSRAFQLTYRSLHSGKFSLAALGLQESIAAGTLQSSTFAKQGAKRDISLFTRRKLGWQERGILVDTHGEAGQDLSEKDYHRIADLTLGEMMTSLEALIDDIPDISDPDLEYSQGVLTLNLGSHGTYVINKQAPNKQIWMSSPLSGPVRYDLIDGQWIYKHDGHQFHERLAAELRAITGKESLQLELDPDVSKGFVGYGPDPT